MKNLAYIVVEDKIMDKKKVEMSVEENIDEMKKSLKNLEESDCYDVGKYTYSLLHQTRQLEYFYCQLLEQEEATPDQTFYHVSKRPKFIKWLILILEGAFLKKLWMLIGAMF